MSFDERCGGAAGCQQNAWGKDGFYYTCKFSDLGLGARIKAIRVPELSLKGRNCGLDAHKIMAAIRRWEIKVGNFRIIKIVSQSIIGSRLTRAKSGDYTVRFNEPVVKFYNQVIRIERAPR
jgi:hypothetical protein